MHPANDSSVEPAAQYKRRSVWLNGSLVITLVLRLVSSSSTRAILRWVLGEILSLVKAILFSRFLFSCLPNGEDSGVVSRVKRGVMSGVDHGVKRARHHLAIVAGRGQCPSWPPRH